MFKSPYSVHLIDIFSGLVTVDLFDFDHRNLQIYVEQTSVQPFHVRAPVMWYNNKVA